MKKFMWVLFVSNVALTLADILLTKYAIAKIGLEIESVAIVRTLWAMGIFWACFYKVFAFVGLGFWISRDGYGSKNFKAITLACMAIWFSYVVINNIKEIGSI